VEVTYPAAYWELALPHHRLVVGPLVSIAESGLPLDQIWTVEQHQLEGYVNQNKAVPLPDNILTELAAHQRAEPGDDRAAWLVTAREHLLSAPTLGEVRRRRPWVRCTASCCRNFEVKEPLPHALIGLPFGASRRQAHP
jgi:hypothetical protein